MLFRYRAWAATVASAADRRNASLAFASRSCTQTGLGPGRWSLSQSISTPRLPGLPKLLRLPPQVGFLRLDDVVRAVAQELRVPLGHAEFPRRHRVPELPLALVPPAVHRPIPQERHGVLAREDRLHSDGGPVLEPLGYLLDRRPVGIEVTRVHRAEVARGVGGHETAWVEPPDDLFRPHGARGVPQGPRGARVLYPVDHVRVHVFAVPGRVVAGRVAHHRRVILGHPDIELRVLRVAVARFGIRRHTRSSM